ncbi:MAG: CDP-alcohol phosphatidyltransferase family protein [Spirochaetales bacterium]|nr:CDP-alcohol phosphatidyltransferase family protein [Spirochaetales bacterium]
MSQSSSLKLSIILSVAAYFLIQCLLWVLSVSPSVAMSRSYAWYFPTSALLHLGMAGFLWWRSIDFRHTTTREPLPAVNAACHLTLFRLSCVPTILFLAIAVAQSEASGVILVVVVAVAFVTDFFDGQVARRLNQTTDIGAYLDSSTDYAVLIVLSIAFVIMKVTPIWYFGILMGRLIGFAIAMAILTKVQGKVDAETTFLGKAAVFAAMTVYAFELARYVNLAVLGDATLVLVVEIASAIILGVSVVDKYVYLVRKFRAAASE